MGQRMRRCACCGCYFRPEPRVKGQRYCGKRRCQQARKNKWQRQKLKIDIDHQSTKQESQQVWLESNEGYWKRYRHKNPNYVERNRQLQRVRDRRRSDAAKNRLDFADLAKKDALASFFVEDTMRYFLLPAADNLAKKDMIMVKIVPIPPG